MNPTTEQLHLLHAEAKAQFPNDNIIALCRDEENSQYVTFDADAAILRLVLGIPDGGSPVERIPAWTLQPALKLLFEAGYRVAISVPAEP